MAAGWIPNNNNGPLSLFQELLALEVDDEGPTEEDGEWARSEFEEVFETYPRIQDAYWETIVKLWRLSRLEDETETMRWQDYFLAWIVRWFSRNRVVSC